MSTEPDARLPVREFWGRQEAVAWYHAEHCPSRYRDHAVCVLEPGHVGDWHEGNGDDAWGPKYWTWRTEDEKRWRSGGG